MTLRTFYENIMHNPSCASMNLYHFFGMFDYVIKNTTKHSKYYPGIKVSPVFVTTEFFEKFAQLKKEGRGKDAKKLKATLIALFQEDYKSKSDDESNHWMPVLDGECMLGYRFYTHDKIRGVILYIGPMDSK